LPDGKGLLSFGRDNKLLTWPVEGPCRDWRPLPGKLGEKTLQGLWEDLLGDGLAQYGALALMAEIPAQSLPFLRERIKPVAEVPPQKLKDLMANLHSSDFNVRKRAARELRGLGELALPALRGARTSDFAGRLLSSTEGLYPTREQGRALRGIEVLRR